MDRQRLIVFRDFVMNLAKLSKCTDKGVAAIITDKEGTQVYSIGINGGPKHGADCLCKLGGKYTCVHAEANALAKCTVADPSKVFICSFSPCVTCAALIVNSGASAVYYVEKYKDDAGLKVLRDAGIEAMCIDSHTLELDSIIDKLRMGHVVTIDLGSPERMHLFQEVKEYASKHGHVAEMHVTFGALGCREVAVRWVNFNG